MKDKDIRFAAHFAAIPERNTAVGPLNRLFLLEEVVFRELESWKFISRRGNMFYIQARNSWVLRQPFKFSVPGIGIPCISVGRLSVWAPDAASAQEVIEELALSQVGSNIGPEDTYILEVYKKWEYERGHEAAADAEADYQAAYL